MDEETKKEIMEELDKIKFGNIRIELNETADHIDLITERRKRIYKKNKKKTIIKNKPHEG